MTVQAPHCPRSQPFFVPVKCRRSRRRSRSVTRGSSSSIVLFTPFTVRVVEMLMQCSEPAMVMLCVSVSRPHIRRVPPLFKPHGDWTFGMRQWEKSTRKPRVDAVRNRERVLEAAKAVFSAGGAEASLEAVARAAGVGIGTLYRHFPTREDLFEAVYRREVQQLADLAEQLKQEAQPVDALRRWLRSNVKFVATKKGMSAALALAAYKNSELFSYSFDRLTRSVE